MVIAKLVLLVSGLNLAALAFTETGSNTAIWWPAVGASVVLYLLYGGPQWQVLVIIAVSGVAVFVVALGPQGRSALLGTVRGMVRFFAAVIASSLPAGLAAALAFVVFVGASPNLAHRCTALSAFRMGHGAISADHRDVTIGALGSAAGVSSALVVQIYLLSMALTTQSITAVRSERAELRAENLLRAGLLRGGFVGSQVGSVFIRRQPNASSSILEINEVAASLVDPQWVDPLIEAWTHSGADNPSTKVLLDNGRTVQVYGRRLPTSDGETVLGLQLVDIADCVAAQEALANAVAHERRVAEELRALATQKDEFVAAVMHELRTPITSIAGFAEELNETAEADQRQASDITLRNATRLSEMVEELRELGQMTAPNPKMERTTVEIRLSLEAALVTGHGNTLGRIATNLLANTITFAPADGTVIVSTACIEGTVRLVVDDSRPGISDDDHPHVFERFFRSADAKKCKVPGSGLGLSIVKSLVELLEGTIAIDRSPLGGARVTLSLPRPTRGSESD